VQFATTIPAPDSYVFIFYFSLLLLVGILDVIPEKKEKRPTGHHPVFIGLMYRYGVIVKGEQQKKSQKTKKDAPSANRPTTKMESS
jgi:hypothetical protein